MYSEETLEEAWEKIHDGLEELHAAFEETRSERVEDAKIRALYRITRCAEIYQQRRKDIEFILARHEAPTEQMIAAARSGEQELFHAVDAFKRLEAEESKPKYT